MRSLVALASPRTSVRTQPRSDLMLSEHAQRGWRARCAVTRCGSASNAATLQQTGLRTACVRSATYARLGALRCSVRSAGVRSATYTPELGEARGWGTLGRLPGARVRYVAISHVHAHAPVPRARGPVAQSASPLSVDRPGAKDGRGAWTGLSQQFVLSPTILLRTRQKYVQT